MTASPTIDTHIGDERALLETVPEVILKKVYYRGRSLKPRDIFDIAVAAENHSESLIKELRGYRGEVSRALAGLDALNVDFVDQAISELVIKDRYQKSRGPPSNGVRRFCVPSNAFQPASRS